MSRSFDVVVVGAGPAGTSTALGLAERGVRVLLLEKKERVGIPVQCGEFMPELDEIRSMLPSVEHAEEIFDVPGHLKARRTERLVLVSPRGRRFVFAFSGYSTARDRFDMHLAERARRAGAEIRTGTRVVSLRRNEKGGYEVGFRVGGLAGSVTAGVVVGADGPFTPVGRCAGFPAQRLTPAVSCNVRGGFGDDVLMYFGSVAPGGYAWVIPKDGAANMGVGVGPELIGRANLRDYLDRFLERADALEMTSPPVGGFIPMHGPRPVCVRGGILLVGDAAGHVMATNGGGIPIAMICGRIAGRVTASYLEGSCSLQEYDREWRRQVGRELETARRVKRTADMLAFRSDLMLEVCMRALGAGRLERAVRCRSIFP